LFLDVTQEEDVEAFGFDTNESQESEFGRGESLLHLEGKRQRDQEDDTAARRNAKRKNRASTVSPQNVHIKNFNDQRREEKLTAFSSLAKVASLCSGQEQCCSNRCLQVRMQFSLSVCKRFCLERKQFTVSVLTYSICCKQHVVYEFNVKPSK
jgi:hypothetical protein